MPPHKKWFSYISCFLNVLKSYVLLFSDQSGMKRISMKIYLGMLLECWHLSISYQRDRLPLILLLGFYLKSSLQTLMILGKLFKIWWDLLICTFPCCLSLNFLVYATVKIFNIDIPHSLQVFYPILLSLPSLLMHNLKTLDLRTFIFAQI